MNSSGIPKALNTDTQMIAAGQPHGITLAGDSHGEAYDSRSFESERRFYATISSGSPGQLVAAYRDQVERTITNMGGEIQGTGIFGSTHDVRDFSCHYAWRRNDGFVRVYSFVGTNGQVQVVMFCYEHRM